MLVDEELQITAVFRSNHMESCGVESHRTYSYGGHITSEDWKCSYEFIWAKQLSTRKRSLSEFQLRQELTVGPAVFWYSVCSILMSAWIQPAKWLKLNVTFSTMNFKDNCYSQEYYKQSRQCITGVEWKSKEIAILSAWVIAVYSHWEITNSLDNCFFWPARN